MRTNKCTHKWKLSAITMNAANIFDDLLQFEYGFCCPFKWCHYSEITTDWVCGTWSTRIYRIYTPIHSLFIPAIDHKLWTFMLVSKNFIIAMFSMKLLYWCITITIRPKRLKLEFGVHAEIKIRIKMVYLHEYWLEYWLVANIYRFVFDADKFYYELRAIDSNNSQHHPHESRSHQYFENKNALFRLPFISIVWTHLLHYHFDFFSNLVFDHIIIA